jgi:ABC-type transport system involved in multi-copper enzyme maturation permease subunit
MSKVFAAELKKLLKLQHLLLVFILALSVRTVLCFVPTAHEHPYSDEVYKRYTTQLSGELTNEKTELLGTRLAEIQALIADYDAMQQRYQRSEIDLSEYSDFTARHGIAKAEEKTVAYLCEKYAKLSECSGFEREVFCDTDWADLFAENGYDYIMLITLLCIAVPAFDTEFSSGSYAQIATSKRGRSQTALAKLMAVSLAVFVLSVMMSAARLGVFAYQHGFDFSDKPAGNVLLTNSLGKTTLLGYFATDSLLKAVAFVFYALAACAISAACKNVTFSFVLSFLVCVTPLFVLDNSGSVLVCASVLYKMYNGFSAFKFAFISLLKSVAVGILALGLWRKAHS